MDPIFLIALLAPILITAVAWWWSGGKITLAEAGIQLGIVFVVTSCFWFIGRFSDTTNVEVWNGEITKKNAQTEQCPWGWRDSTDWFCTEYTTRRVKDGPPREECTPYTDSNGKRKKRCHMVQDYKTQYKYDYDWERRYFLNTNVKANFEVSRIDPQGVKYPPLFNQAYVGQPASAKHTYTDWIKAASDSVFHQDGAAEEKYKDILPDYPNYVYDLYKIDRVIRVGNVDAPIAEMNRQLAESLKAMGGKKQINVIVVLIDAKLAPSEEYSLALRRYWSGFKKNDAVLFLAVDPASKKLVWANSLSWSKKAMYDVTMRRTYVEQIGKQIDYTAIVGNIERTAYAHYERRSMKEFEFLKDQIPVPNWLIFVVMVVSVGGSLGLAWFFHRNDVA